jgi:hypothetical protein
MHLPHSQYITSLLIFFGLVSISHAEGASLKKSNGNEFELSVSSYRYEEPSLGMSNMGDKFGVNHLGTKALNGDWFIKDDVRFAHGSVDYAGSGFQPSTPDLYLDARGMVGRDIQMGNSMFSPFTGIGYRFLYNDLRGFSSTGALGYRRESNYLYIPIGLTHRYVLDDSAVLATTFEFDKFLTGKQLTRLSDLSGYSGYSGVTDVVNRQSGGFGFRADMLYEMSDWAFGPFIHIWHIDKSDTALRLMLCDGTVRWCALTEPQNRTAEFGMRMRFRY